MQLRRPRTTGRLYESWRMRRRYLACLQLPPPAYQIQRKRLLTVIAYGDKLLGMELRQLAAFVAVAEEGSFTRASDRLNVVQSAVSANVRNLERELGARLFDRSTHKVALTAEGHALLPEARATLQATMAARDAVDAVRGGVRGTVMLGIMQAQGNIVSVARVLAEFRSAHPAVQVHVRHAAGGSGEMALQVREGRLDLAFVAAPAGELPGVQLTALAGDPFRLVLAASHPLAARKIVELAALTDETHADF